MRDHRCRCILSLDSCMRMPLALQQTSFCVSTFSASCDEQQSAAEHLCVQMSWGPSHRVANLAISQLTNLFVLLLVGGVVAQLGGHAHLSCLT
jgi:hypothetical protein